MNKTKHILATCAAGVLLTGTLMMPGLASAQVIERTTTTTTSTGTLAEFGPGAIVVRSETSPDPLRYTYTDKTVYVDETGAAVSRETLRSGAPLTVHYTKVGGTLVADRVIIGNMAGDPRAATTTTRTTTTSGTIADFGPGAIAIRTESAPEPIRYTYGETTTYVDENGAPVSIETVRSGVPVTVHYTQDGNRMVATRVVVRRSAVVPVPVPAPAPVIEERRTTTTTTTPKRADDDDDDGK